MSAMNRTRDRLGKLFQIYEWLKYVVSIVFLIVLGILLKRTVDAPLTRRPSSQEAEARRLLPEAEKWIRSLPSNESREMIALPSSLNLLSENHQVYRDSVGATNWYYFVFDIYDRTNLIGYAFNQTPDLEPYQFGNKTLRSTRITPNWVRFEYP